MTTATADIEDLFCQGRPFDDIVKAGDWTRDDVVKVLRDRQWDLDPSGRLPRSKRVTVPRGLGRSTPVPPAGKKATPTKRTAAPRSPANNTPGRNGDRRGPSPVPPEQSAAAGGTPSSHRTGGSPRTATTSPVAPPASSPPTVEPTPPAPPRPTVAETVPQLVIAHPEGDRSARDMDGPEPEDLAPAPPTPHAGADHCAICTPPAPAEPAQQPPDHTGTAMYPVDVDYWLASAQRSPRLHVRLCANTALVALLQLRCALDDLARVERSIT